LSAWLQQSDSLTPAPLAREDTVVGRIGASNAPGTGGPRAKYQVQHRLGLAEAFPAAVAKTYEYSVLTLKVIWRILTGQASVHNLSGPITIADARPARQPASGFVYFLKFLAIVSISLGVLNLLPVPMLDGGHLLYYAIEAVKGSPVSEAAMIQGQKIGLLAADRPDVVGVLRRYRAHLRVKQAVGMRPGAANADSGQLPRLYPL
jgi:regulator of sigma E protease